MKRSVTRTRGSRYCKVTITLEGERLSITGEEGRVITRPQAKKQAYEFWKSFFEDSPEEIFSMNKKCGTKFSSPASAARYVLKSDGELYGLDVTYEGADKVYCCESGGQISETIRSYFPEVVPLLPWHLNDMKAACEHQEKLGWGHGKDIALTADALTPVQKEVFEKEIMARYEEKVKREVIKTIMAWTEDPQGRVGLYTRVFNKTPSISDIQQMLTHGNVTSRKAHEFVRGEVKKTHKPEVFRAEIFEDSLRAPCPECGYRYGTSWLVRKLPEEIIKLAQTVLSPTEHEDGCNNVRAQ